MLKNKVVFDMNIFKVDSVWHVKTLYKTFWGTVTKVTDESVEFWYYLDHEGSTKTTITVGDILEKRVVMYEVYTAEEPMPLGVTLNESE